MPAPVSADAPTPVVGEIEAFLKELLSHMPPDSGEGTPGRPRVWPSVALWGGILVCILHNLRSQLDLGRQISDDQLWDYPRFPVSDQAIYKRLAEAGTVPLERLLAQVRDVLTPRLAPYAATDLAPFAREVLLLDETTLDPVARTLPVLRDVPIGDRQLLPGKMAGVFDVRRQLWRHPRHIPNPDQNEKVAARELVATLPSQSLILADLGYFGFAWFDDLTDAGHCWLSRLRGQTSTAVLHPAYQHGDTLDQLVWLGAHRADRAKYAVRLVQFRVGRTLHRFVTNVLDPKVFSIRQIAECYARRWDSELAIKLVKRELGLHLLWSAKETVILQQVWGVLIIAQILQALRLEVAGRAGVDPFDVSLPLLVRYLPRWAARGYDPVARAVELGVGMRIIRPSRRTVIDAPSPALTDYVLPPPKLMLEREPRYAKRKCGSRKTANVCI